MGSIDPWKECSGKERALFKRLRTPQDIQTFLNRLPFNFERHGNTCMSPRRVLQERRAHCLEGALLAAALLWFHGESPLLMDLKAADTDDDHVLTLFRRNGRWGAISKTNHAVLRYREAVYKTPRELAMSYFHEYFLPDGHKTLRSFSRPFSLAQYRFNGWVITQEDCWDISDALDRSPHEAILSPNAWRALRRADPIEINAGEIVEWHKS